MTGTLDMKVSIIGGGGRVGASAAFALQCYNIVCEIHILDANEQAAQGEALDLLHGASFAGDPTKVIGLGTQLDTCRFRSLIASEIGLPPSQVKALILGEHGDTMVPIWSSATAAGMPLLKLPGFTTGVQQKVFDRTKTGGAEA